MQISSSPEVAPYASGNTAYEADWIELTNMGSSAVNLTGWKMDDNSNSFAAGAALRGVTSIAAGQSVIFLESNASGTNDAAINAGFKSAWFGSNVPAGTGRWQLRRFRRRLEHEWRRGEHLQQRRRLSRQRKVSARGPPPGKSFSTTRPG